MTILAQARNYTDVNGTDRSSRVVGIPIIHNELSTVSTATVVLDNHDASLASAFSKHQVIAVSIGRAAINSNSDYFTGVDGAAPSAAKWAKAGNGTADIYHNLLHMTGAAAGGWTVLTSQSTFTVPYSFTIWVKTSPMDTNTLIIHGKKADTAADWWEITVNNTPHWYTYHRWAAAWVADWTGLSFPVADTWYSIEVNQTTSTSVTITIRDVYGNQVDGRTVAHDQNDAGFKIMLAVAQNANVISYWDSFILCASATMVAAQRFEGYVDEIVYTPAGTQVPTITLQCSGYESELSDQYDDPYGKATTTFTPGYGATDDVSAHTTELVPSGTTAYCPDCAIHDPQVVSINTRRIDAINEFIISTPYLGWYMLPMKHLCMVMPDTNPAPDAYTEATTNWTAVNHTTFSASVNYVVDGAKNLYLYKNAAGTFYAYHDTSISTDYTLLHLYYATLQVDSLTIKLTTAAGYWYYSLPLTSMGATWNMQHFIIRLPDSNGDHGWSKSGSPSGTITRVTMEAVVSSWAEGYFYWDVLYFAAAQRLTSKYTLTAPVSVSRADRSDNITQVMLTYSGGSSITVDDLTAQAVDGVHTFLTTDLNITTIEAARAEARGIINAEGYGVTTDPVRVDYLDPGDMYTVMLGDTLTVSDTYSNLSNAKRTLVARDDSFTEGKGWVTTLYLSGQYPERSKDAILSILSMSKRKRY